MLALLVAGWLDACAAQLGAAAGELAGRWTIFERPRVAVEEGRVRLVIASGPWKFVATVHDEPGEPRPWHLVRARGRNGGDSDEHVRRSERREARLSAGFQRWPKVRGDVEERFAAFAAAFRPAADRCLAAE